MALTKRDQYILAALVILAIVWYYSYSQQQTSASAQLGANPAVATGPSYDQSGLTVDAIAFLGGALG